MDAQRQEILAQLDALIADSTCRGDRIKALQMKIDLLGLGTGPAGPDDNDAKRPGATGPQYPHDPAHEAAMQDFKLRERALKLDAAISKNAKKGN